MKCKVREKVPRGTRLKKVSPKCPGLFHRRVQRLTEPWICDDSFPKDRNRTAVGSLQQGGQTWKRDARPVTLIIVLTGDADILSGIYDTRVRLDAVLFGGRRLDFEAHLSIARVAERHNGRHGRRERTWKRKVTVFSFLPLTSAAGPREPFVRTRGGWTRAAIGPLHWEGQLRFALIEKGLTSKG